MRPPRMRVAVVGQPDDLCEFLDDAGHHLEFDQPWSALGDFDLIVLAVPADVIPDVVARLQPVVGPKHIVVHTALEVGPEALTDLPSLAIAMHSVGREFVVSTVDEISDAVAAALVAEMGGNMWRIPENERIALAEALELAKQANALKLRALNTVRSEAAKDVVIRQLGGW